MTIKGWIDASTAKITKAGIVTARLDTLVLLEDAAGKDRAWLLAHPEFELDAKTVGILKKQVQRRAGQEPLAYIRGKSEFYGREFLVTPDTLQPRAETETMIDMFKALNLKNPVIADIGTGSGCIAISAALELQGATVYATEINQAAVGVAEKNAEKLGGKVQFYKGNLLEPLFDVSPAPQVLLCNLPYVPDSHTINQAAMQEPKIAIFGGEDGLDLYRELFAQLSKIATKLQFILTESLPFQHETLVAISSQHGYKQMKEDDFIQIFERA